MHGLLTQFISVLSSACATKENKDGRKKSGNGRGRHGNGRMERGSSRNKYGSKLSKIELCRLVHAGD